MRNRTQEQVRELETRFPRFQVWTVPHATDGGATWCSRPWGSDDARETINASSAEELGALLAEADE
jgi:hypothetical protein